jgi:hypothetical protein
LAVCCINIKMTGCCAHFQPANTAGNRIGIDFWDCPMAFRPRQITESLRMREHCKVISVS